MFNWDDVRYFLTLQRQATLAAAGAALELDPTTIGRRLVKLEEELGARLFEQRFGSDEEVVGSTRIDDQRALVTGVLPALPLDMDLLPTLATVPSFDLVMSLPVEDPGRTTHGSENYNVLAKLDRDARAAAVDPMTTLKSE